VETELTVAGHDGVACLLADAKVTAAKQQLLGCKNGMEKRRRSSRGILLNLDTTMPPMEIMV
jgi:hypothetical protein